MGLTPRRRASPRRKPYRPHRLREAGRRGSTAGRRRTAPASPPFDFPAPRGSDQTEQQSARTGLSASASDVRSRKGQILYKNKSIGKLHTTIVSDPREIPHATPPVHPVPPRGRLPGGTPPPRSRPLRRPQGPAGPGQQADQPARRSDP